MNEFGQDLFISAKALMIFGGFAQIYPLHQTSAGRTTVARRAIHDDAASIYPLIAEAL